MAAHAAESRRGEAEAGELGDEVVDVLRGNQEDALLAEVADLVRERLGERPVGRRLRAAVDPVEVDGLDLAVEVEGEAVARTRLDVDDLARGSAIQRVRKRAGAPPPAAAGSALARVRRRRARGHHGSRPATTGGP